MSKIKDQLRRLLALQKHELKIKRLEEEQEKLPRELEDFRRDVEKLKSIVDEEMSQLREIVQWRDEQERHLKEEEEQIQKQLEYMKQVNDAREYLMVQKSLDNLKRRAKDHEGEILSLMDKVEERQKILAERQAQVDALMEKVAQREAEVSARLAEIEQELEQVRKDIPSLEADIDRAYLRTYRSIARKRFPPMASVENTICGVCHMGMPPQLANQLYNPPELLRCPHCGRILYMEEALEEA